MKKFIKIAIIVLVLFFVIALGLYAYIHFESKNEFSLYGENRFIVYSTGISTVVMGGLGNTEHYYEVDLSKKKMDYRGDTVFFDIKANEDMSEEERNQKRKFLATYFLSNEEVERFRACILNIKSKQAEIEESLEYESYDNTQNDNTTKLEQVKDEIISKNFYYIIKFKDETIEVLDSENIKELKRLINEIIV